MLPSAQPPGRSTDCISPTPIVKHSMVGLRSDRQRKWDALNERTPNATVAWAKLRLKLALQVAVCMLIVCSPRVSRGSRPFGPPALS